MKTGVLLGGVMVGLLMLLAGMRVASTEQKLATAALAVLQQPAHDGRFDQVKVSFSGQQAVLTGSVATPEDRAVLDRLMSDAVRADFGLNPVLGVENQVQVNATQKIEHSRPWLLVVMMTGKVTIAGVLPSEADKVNAAQALASKLAPQGTLLDNQLQAPPHAQPATDLAATLRDLPDLAGLALNDKTHAAIAASACDGHWTLLTGDQDSAAVALALAAARPQPSDIARATATLTESHATAREQDRIARLASPVVGLMLLGKELRVIGSLGDEDSKRRVLIALSTAYPDLKLSDQIQVASEVQPGGDWPQALARVPKDVAAPTLFVLTPGAKPTIWDGQGSAADLQKLLTTASASHLSAQAIWDAFAAARKAVPATDSPQK